MYIGEINQASDNQITIFMIFDHTTFQITISLSLFILAIIEVANSGKLVQIASIVSHITVSDIPKLDAIFILASTITFAHSESQIIHQMIYNIAFQFGNLSECSICSSSRFSIIQKVYDKKIIKNNINTRESHIVMIFSVDFQSITSYHKKNSASETTRIKGTSLNTVEFFALRG